MSSGSSSPTSAHPMLSSPYSTSGKFSFDDDKLPQHHHWTLPAVSQTAKTHMFRRTLIRVAFTLVLVLSLLTLSTYVGKHPYLVNGRGANSLFATQAPLNVTKPPRIIKVTAAYGKGGITDYGADSVLALRERVLQGHIDHANAHGHIQFIQRSDMFNNIFTKAGTVLNVLLSEMAKPEEQRSEWIWAHDSDMVLMNRNLSLESFLPPPGKDYNLLVTYDGNGLNIGSFFIKVNTWSVELMSAVIGSQHLSFGSPGLYPDQDVMEDLISNIDYFKEKAIEVPRRWINAFPPGWAGGFIEGDLLVHCVWWGKELMPDFVKQSEAKLAPLNPRPEEFMLGQNITKFWEGTLEKDAV